MRKGRSSLISRLRNSFRRDFITGVLVLAPIGAVFWIVIWLWNILVKVTVLFAGSARSNIATTALILGLITAFVWFVGLVSGNYIGRKALGAFSHVLARVPVLSTVYSTLEQLLKTFASGKAKNFRRVVQIEYPRKGLYALALVTAERGKHFKVYVPTTPNPTSGFYLTVPADEVEEVDMSVEDALKEIISMGIVQKESREESRV